MRKQIFFFAADTSFSLRNRKQFRSWITAVIRKEGFRTGSINYVFCSDDYLRELNIKHLSHKTFTDIITFDLSQEKKKLSGEIYISIDRVRDNAVLFKVPFYNELSRVMIHGILHLCGYKDKSQHDIRKMRRKENIYIEKFWKK